MYNKILGSVTSLYNEVMFLYNNYVSFFWDGHALWFQFTLSWIAPLVQGIIENFKTLYRSKVDRNLLRQIDGEQAAAMRIVDKSWRIVTEATIANCFRTCGFAKRNPYATNDALIKTMNMIQSQTMNGKDLQNWLQLINPCLLRNM